MTNLAQVINELCADVHKENEKWWIDLDSGLRLNRNKAEMIALMHSELSEALEGIRKNLQDDHLPHRSSVEVELADTVIRICDFAGGFNLDLGGAIVEKRMYNRIRADHKEEARKGIHGKKI